MKCYVLFFRGINVGGKNILKMQDLKNALMDVGFNSVESYIQSGNFIVWSGEKELQILEKTIGDMVRRVSDIDPKFLVIPINDYEKIVNANPFPQATRDPKTLHFYFLSTSPVNPDLGKLHAISKESEQFELIGKVVYLCAPEGIGRSRLAANIEKTLGVDATARNWRTVDKMLTLTRKRE